MFIVFPNHKTSSWESKWVPPKKLLIYLPSAQWDKALSQGIIHHHFTVHLLNIQPRGPLKAPTCLEYQWPGHGEHPLNLNIDTKKKWLGNQSCRGYRLHWHQDEAPMPWNMYLFSNMGILGIYDVNFQGVGFWRSALGDFCQKFYRPWRFKFLTKMKYWWYSGWVRL